MVNWLKIVRMFRGQMWEQVNSKSARKEQEPLFLGWADILAQKSYFIGIRNNCKSCTSVYFTYTTSKTVTSPFESKTAQCAKV